MAISSDASRRLKYTAILLAVLASALALTASTQTWYTLHLTASSGHEGVLTVAGSDAAPAIAALSLAGVAFGAALALAGRILRYVLAVLGAVLGIGILGSTVGAMSDPVGSGIAVVTTTTGVAGDASVRAIVAAADSTVWPALALTGGIALLVAAVLVLATGHLWPVTSRRYGATAESSEGRQTAPDDDAEHLSAADERARARDAAIGDWDELSRGDDPTAGGPDEADETDGPDPNRR